jgi:hypothetical protein
MVSSKVKREGNPSRGNFWEPWCGAGGEFIQCQPNISAERPIDVLHDACVEIGSLLLILRIGLETAIL